MFDLANIFTQHLPCFERCNGLSEREKATNRKQNLGDGVNSHVIIFRDSTLTWSSVGETLFVVESFERFV